MEDNSFKPTDLVQNTMQTKDIIIGQLKTMDNIRKLLTMLLYSAYLIYRLVAEKGTLALNIILLVLTLVYASFFISFISLDKRSINKKTIKTITKVYSYSKLFFGLIGATISIVGLLSVYKSFTTINTIFAILLPVFLILQVIFDILIEYATYCFNLIADSIKKDVAVIVDKYEKPINTVKKVKQTVDSFSNFKQGVVGLAKTIFGRKKPKEQNEELVAITSEEDNRTETNEIIIIDPKDKE